MPHSESSQSSQRPGTITITVLYFAAALTATGITSEAIEISLPSPSIATNASESTDATQSEAPGFPLSGLDQLLSQRYPGTNLDKILKTSQWSVDAEMVYDPDSVLLKGGEEVAVICPVSGG